jgi:DNA-binding transcriptional LysR family regulator
MDVAETRELRYFVAVAEELNFGRAARRRGRAPPPPLSRAILKLERRLGVALFERTSRPVALTSAGEVLLTEGRKALDAVTAATRRAQRPDHRTWCSRSSPAVTAACCRASSACPTA